MTRRLCVLTVLVAVGSLGGDLLVHETSSQYPCCQSPALEFDQQCTNTWSISDKNFAYSSDDDRRCISPCERIEDGLLVLQRCVAVNVSIVCTHEVNIEESRVYYGSVPCSAAGSHGFVGLLLLVVLICGSCVTC